MTEQQIQSKIINQLEKENWYVIKLIKTSKNGIMDLLCHRQGETMYVEVKRETGKLSELQKIRIKQLEEQGIMVKIWTSYGTDFCER
jgi:Holliday junction resolvase-like predicted endonuclease